MLFILFMFQRQLVWKRLSPREEEVERRECERVEVGRRYGPYGGLCVVWTRGRMMGEGSREGWVVVV